MSTSNPFSAFFKNTGNLGDQVTKPLEPAATLTFRGHPKSVTRLPTTQARVTALPHEVTSKTQLKHIDRSSSHPVTRLPAQMDDLELEERIAIMIEDGGLSNEVAYALALVTSAPCPVDDQTQWQAALDLMLGCLTTPTQVADHA